MSQVASVDYDSKRIYLHADTVTSGFDSIEAYKEIRALRSANTNNERFYAPLISAQGNEPKGGGKFTINRTVLVSGAAFVPFDTSHSLTLLKETINPTDEASQAGCFDRSGLSVGVVVDIDDAAPQVELIQVGVSGLTAAETKRLNEIYIALDLDVDKPQTYADDNTLIVNDDFVRSAENNENGTFTVTRTP